MNRVLVGGMILTVGGTGAYLLGIVTPYPGRAFAVTAVMIGVTLLSIRRVGDGGAP